MAKTQKRDKTAYTYILKWLNMLISPLAIMFNFSMTSAFHSPQIFYKIPQSAKIIQCSEKTLFLFSQNLPLTQNVCFVQKSVQSLVVSAKDVCSRQDMRHRVRIKNAHKGKEHLLIFQKAFLFITVVRPWPWECPCGDMLTWPPRLHKTRSLNAKSIYSAIHVHSFTL